MHSKTLSNKSKQNKTKIQAWYFTPVIPALRGLIEEDYEFEAS
jgi:hypothetical protein